MPETSHFYSEQWPVKAYNNRDFLNGSDARSIRVQCELLEPEYRLKMLGIRNTIVFFGSARLKAPEVAQSNLQELEEKIQKSDSRSEEMEDRLSAAKRDVRTSAYYRAASDLARMITKWSMTIRDPLERFLVCSGGGPGIMEAANRGAFEAGGRSIGLGISLPFEQGNNSYITRDLNFEFHYFFVRKYWFLYLAKSLLVFPGGFGTMDELFEVMTLIQTKKTEKRVPIVLFGSEFWEKVVSFDTLVDWGVVSKKDLKLFRIMDSVEETYDFITNEMTQHYMS